VKDGKWQEASVPSSYFLEATAAGAKPKRSGRKPKEPISQPEPVAEAAITPASDAAKAKAVRQKPGRKPAIAKANASQKTARSKIRKLSWS
jgi:Flp pilus assembly protein CpaB